MTELSFPCPVSPLSTSGKPHYCYPDGRGLVNVVAQRELEEPFSIGRVLLVDDEERIRNFVRRALEAEGLSVECAGDGDEALRKIRSRPYDLVILDLVMPGLDWRILLRRIVEQNPTQAVLVLSALNDTGSKVAALEHG